MINGYLFNYKNIKFTFIQDVVPFIAEHWDQLMPNRQQSLNWPTHIYRALTTESVFSSEIEGEETFYSLADEVSCYCSINVKQYYDLEVELRK